MVLAGTAIQPSTLPAHLICRHSLGHNHSFCLLIVGLIPELAFKICSHIRRSPIDNNVITSHTVSKLAVTVIGRQVLHRRDVVSVNGILIGLHISKTLFPGTEDIVRAKFQPYLFAYVLFPDLCFQQRLIAAYQTRSAVMRCSSSVILPAPAAVKAVIAVAEHCSRSVADTLTIYPA